MRHFLFTRTLEKNRTFCSSSSACSVRDVFLPLLNGASFLQAVLKTVTGHSACMIALPCSVIAVRISFDSVIFLYLFSVVDCLIKRKAVSDHMLPASGNLIGFAVYSMGMAFTSGARAADVDSVAQLMSAYLWFDDELGKFKVFGSRANGYVPFEHRTSLEASIRPMYDVPGMDSAALLLFPAEDEAFYFLTYMFFSHFYSPISSA